MENDLYGTITDPSQQWLKQDDWYMAARLREEGQKWVEDKRQNAPDMFAAWLQMHKDAIQAGEGHLVGLPADFTMEDYYHYVKEPFSTLA